MRVSAPATLPVLPLALLIALAGCQPVTRPVTATTANGADALPIDARFRCMDGTVLTIRFAGEQATVDGPDGLLVTLAQQPSGSGFRYAGSGYALSGKGRNLGWTAPGRAERVCTEIEESEMSQPPLGNTRWQLVEFQSPNDRIGTIRPAAPERYALTFQADGSLAMQFDCNRGTGQWRADGSSLTIIRGATTRAMCPPGSWDMLFARDLGNVRSYVVRDGDLYLALMTDGGIYRWRPVS